MSDVGLLLSIAIGVLFSTGIYMMLRENLVRVIIGVILLSNSVNLLLLTMGRLTRNRPPLIEEGKKTIEAPANPLPQALILTAIVIGFGLLAFSLVLAVRAYHHEGTLNTDAMRTAEPLYPDEMEEPEDELESERGNDNGNK